MHPLEGLIPLIGGVWLLMRYYEIIPVKDEHRLGFNEWKARYRTLVRVCGPGCIIFGTLILLGVFS